MKKESGSMAGLIVASCLFASGGALVKVSDGFTRVGPSLGVVGMLVVGAFLFARALRNDALTTMWIVGLGIQAAVSVVLGMWLFREDISSFQIAGIVLIVGGTVLTELA